jgi:hypothetical protein
VTFAGAPAVTPRVASDTVIRVTVPAGAVTGQAMVTTANGTASTGFTVRAGGRAAAPTITGFSPGSGPAGTPVTISGANLAGTTAVTIGGVPAVFTVNPGGISTVVPAGAATGQIRVTTSGGTAASAATFTVAKPPAPKVTGLSPASGTIGSRTTLLGSNLSQTSSVSIGGVPATFVVVSDSQLSVTIPAGTTGGRFTVTTPGGSVTGAATYRLR